MIPVCSKHKKTCTQTKEKEHAIREMQMRRPSGVKYLAGTSGLQDGVERENFLVAIGRLIKRRSSQDLVGRSYVPRSMAGQLQRWLL
jgi:hypothetical protein